MLNVKYYLILFFSLLIFNSRSFAEPLEDDISRDDNQTFHLYDDIDLVSTMKIQYAKPRVVVKAVYPQLASDTLQAGPEAFNQLILAMVQEEVANYTAKVLANLSFQKKLPRSLIKNELYIDYSSSYLKSNQDHIMSIRLSIQGYVAGMAHPYHYHRVLNYDLDTRQTIELNTLFVADADYLQLLSTYTSASLSKRFPKAMIAYGTSPTVQNFKNWNIKTNGLLITFDEASVAPAVYGAQTILVPYDALKSILAPDAVISGCILRPSRCNHNRLLTGGFIDEAINTQHSRFDPILAYV